MTRLTDRVVTAALVTAGAATLVGLNPSVLPPWRYHVASDYVTVHPVELTESAGDDHRTPQPAARIIPEFTMGTATRFTIGWFVLTWEQ